MRTLVRNIWVMLALFSKSAWAEEPKLILKQAGKEFSFTRSELLARPDRTKVEIPADPGYQDKAMQYEAVPAFALFEKLSIPDGAVIRFICLDGFSGPIKKERLLNHDSKGSVAYIAIEPENPKWPPLGTGKPSAGPFYLVWVRPEASGIGREEWPFQLSGFEVKNSFKEAYPALLPPPGMSENDPVKRGMRVFAQNCFVCHTFNKQGDSQMGPDLNTPRSPIEYMKEADLRTLIRDPQKLRYWPQAKMAGFPAKVLPEGKLNDLLKYFRFMAAKRKR